MHDILALFTTATYITLAVEFGLGFALGYYLGKLVKALIALLILGFVGVAINYTQFIALIDQVTQQMGVSQQNSST